VRVLRAAKKNERHPWVAPKTHHPVPAHHHGGREIRGGGGLA
jgi:hypothetical protein